MARVNTARPSDEESAPRHDLRALAKFLIDLHRTDGKTILAALATSGSDSVTPFDVDRSALDDNDDRLAAQAELLEEIGYTHAYAQRAVLSNRHGEYEAQM